MESNQNNRESDLNADGEQQSGEKKENSERRRVSRITKDLLKQSSEAIKSKGCFTSFFDFLNKAEKNQGLTE